MIVKGKFNRHYRHYDEKPFFFTGEIDGIEYASPVEIRFKRPDMDDIFKKYETVEQTMAAYEKYSDAMCSKLPWIKVD